MEETIKENNMEQTQIYYQYILNDDGFIVGIHSSKTPFSTRSITLEKIKLVRLGKTKPSDLK
jgi:hypothetical protein